MTLARGERVNERYELLERLGAGGQGSVWKAIDQQSGQLRAIKIVHLPSDNFEAAERARREAHLVKHLAHPGIVRCYSVEDIVREDKVVLVFDFVDAMALSEAVRDPRLDKKARRAVLRHLARVLAYVHASRVVHRDLKPDNVLLTEIFWEDPAAPNAIRLIDFGIASAHRGPEGSTLSGLFGTRPYMAPELFEVQSTDVQRSPARDVYAFGVIGWELFEGRHPTGLPETASAAAFAATYAAFARKKEPWPPKDLGDTWGKVIAQCLALSPRERPRDGAAILGLLGEGFETPVPAPAKNDRASTPGIEAQPSGAKEATPQRVRTETHEVPAAGSTAVPPTVSERPSVAALVDQGKGRAAADISRGTVPSNPALLPPARPVAPTVKEVIVAPAKGDDMVETPRNRSKEGGESTQRSATGSSGKVGESFVWLWVSVLVLAAIVVGGLVFALASGAHSFWAGSHSAIPTPGAQAPSNGSSSPSASNSGVLWLPKPSASSTAAPTTTASSSESPMLPCCPKGKVKCPSGLACDDSQGCRNSPLPDDERFLVKVFGGKYEDVYVDNAKTNLRDLGAARDRICLKGMDGERCMHRQSMSESGGHGLDRARSGAEVKPLTVSIAELRSGLDYWILPEKGNAPMIEGRLKYSGQGTAEALCRSVGISGNVKGNEGALLTLDLYLVKDDQAR
ncbi:MAG: protein kinase [Polyangiaceae bacterium]|nr:protein kinase [Polyangiaceae bacterium]